MNAKKWIVAGVTAGVLSGGVAGLAVGGPMPVSAATISGATGQPAAVVVQHRDGGADRRGGELRGELRGRLRGAALDTAAKAIGITVTELRTALRSGQSIAQVATANGVTPQSVIDALVAEATANINQRITDMVNKVPQRTRPANPTS